MSEICGGPGANFRYFCKGLSTNGFRPPIAIASTRSIFRIPLLAYWGHLMVDGGGGISKEFEGGDQVPPSNH